MTLRDRPLSPTWIRLPYQDTRNFQWLLVTFSKYVSRKLWILWNCLTHKRWHKYFKSFFLFFLNYRLNRFTRNLIRGTVLPLAFLSIALITSSVSSKPFIKYWKVVSNFCSFFLNWTNKQFIQTGGVWINSGPLLYHYSDIPGENSIEPCYDMVKEIIQGLGFIMEVFSKINLSLSTTFVSN